MGALCSGRSENPASIDPPKAKLKPTQSGVQQLPTIAYVPDANLGTNPYATKDPLSVQQNDNNGKLLIEKSDVKNIQVGDSLKAKEIEEAANKKAEEEKAKEEADKKKKEEEEEKQRKAAEQDAKRKQEENDRKKREEEERLKKEKEEAEKKRNQEEEQKR